MSKQDGQKIGVDEEFVLWSDIKEVINNKIYQCKGELTYNNMYTNDSSYSIRDKAASMVAAEIEKYLIQIKQEIQNRGYIYGKTGRYPSY